MTEKLFYQDSRIRKFTARVESCRETEKKVEMEMKINRNVFTMPAEMMQIDINVSPKLPEFRQSNKSRDLIKGDEQEEQQKFYIKMGTVLHSLFSTIRTRDDIEGALKQLELDGVLYDENISRDRVEKMIRSLR